MMAVLLSVSLAGLSGFALSIYFFIYRSNMRNPWRWPAGIFCGLVIGGLMALIDFMMIWPPATILSTTVGIALMLLITFALIGWPKPWQSHKS